MDSGARKIVLVSRKGADSHAAKDLLQELKKRNVRVFSEACDIADSDEVKDLLDCLRDMNMPQVRGVVQGAMVRKVSTWLATASILFVQLNRLSGFTIRKHVTQRLDGSDSAQSARYNQPAHPVVED